MPLLALLTGPLGKIAGISALALGLLAVGALALNQHDARVRAEQNAAAEAQQLATERADHARAVAALEQQAADAEAAAQKLSRVKERINAAPHSVVCVGTGAARAWVDSMRPNGGDAGPAASGATQPAGVPAAAGAAARRAQ